MNERELQVVEAVRLETFETLAEGIRVQVGGRTVEAKLLDWHCCVLASRIAKDVLAEHYIGSRAVKVQTLTYNAKAWAAELAGEDFFRVTDEGSLMRDADTAVFACGFRGDGRQDAASEGMLNGHLVLIVEKEILLDPSAVQFTNLEHGILVEPLAIDLTTVEGREWLTAPSGSFLGTELPEGGAVLYREATDLGGVYDAADWRDVADIKLMKDQVAAQVRARLA